MMKLFCDRRTVIQPANGEDVVVVEITLEDSDNRGDSFATIGYLFNDKEAEAICRFLNLHDFASLIPGDSP